MRYRATIYVDLHTDNKKEAEKKLMDIVLDIPNSFQGDISEMPHGSEISLDNKEPNSS